jgi:hypothetical protein
MSKKYIKVVMRILYLLTIKFIIVLSIFVKFADINAALITNYIGISKEIVGREKELSSLRKLIKSNGYVVIDGLPGIGKTSLVEKFITHAEDKYEIIWYFDCNQSIQDSITKLLGRIQGIGLIEKVSYFNDENIFETLLYFLKNTQIKWLLFFDNFENVKQINLNRFLALKSGALIVASRSQQYVDSSLHISFLNKEDSFRLLEKLGISIDDEGIQELVDFLYGYPIALIQAGKLIKYKAGITPKNYIINANIKMNSLAIEESRMLNRDFTNNYNLHLVSSLNEVISKMIQANKNVKNLLIFLKNNPTNYFSKEMIISYLGKYADGDDLAFEMLLENFLLKQAYNQSNIFVMHDVIKKMIDSSELLSNAEMQDFEKYLDVLNYFLPISFIELRKLFSDYPEIKKITYDTVEKLFTSQACSQNGLEIAIKVMQMDALDCNCREFQAKNDRFKKAISSSNVNILARVMYNIALAYYEAFSHNNNLHASAMLKASLNMLDNQEYDQKFARFTLNNQLSQIYLYSGNLKDGKFYFEQSLKDMDFNSPSHDVALHYFVQAKLELEEGKYDAAEKSIKLSIAADEKLLDLENATIFPSYFLLSEICYRKGDIGQIKKIADKKFVQVMNYAFDSDEQFKSNMLIFSSIALMNTNAVEAKNLAEQALHKLQLKQDHDLGLVYMILGDITTLQKEYELAIEYYKKALNLYFNISDDYHTDETSLIYKKLFDLYYKKNDIYNAQLYYDRHIQKFGINYFRSKTILLESK